MCKLTHFKNRQIANTLQSISVSVLVSATHLQEDLSQLVVVWLYSNINARLPSTDAIFGINCHHAATKSLLIEPFLSLFQIYEVLMNFCVWRWQQISNFNQFIKVNECYHKQTACNYQLVSIPSQTDSRLTWSYCHFIAFLTHQSCFEGGSWLRVVADWSQCSKQPFQRKQDHNIVLHCHSNFGHAAIFSHFYPSVTLSLADDRKNAEIL